MTVYGTDELQRDFAADVSHVPDVPATVVEPPGSTSGLIESSAFVVPSSTAWPQTQNDAFLFLGSRRDPEGHFSACPDEDGQLG